MKKRIVKKWINRYITPHIKDLPRTACWNNEIPDGDMIKVISNNHTIINGVRVHEGEMIPRQYRGGNLMVNIRRTGDLAKQTLESHKHVFLRNAPEVRGRDVRMRLITE